MTTDDLREQLLQTLAQHDPDNYGGLAASWYYEPQADAIMSIIREEQAEAWDEGWDASVDATNKCDIAGGDPCGDCAICRPPNPYTERTDR